jgi:hypothetical protein
MKTMKMMVRSSTMPVRTRNISRSVACRVVGMTWVTNAAWYPLLSWRLALCGNIMLGHVTNCKNVIWYCKGWCNSVINSDMWIHDTLIMGSWFVCISGIPDGLSGVPTLCPFQTILKTAGMKLLSPGLSLAKLEVDLWWNSMLWTYKWF